MAVFQSTLPHGSDRDHVDDEDKLTISIHAPSRERPEATKKRGFNMANFNPRSLTGATADYNSPTQRAMDFNPRSLTGATNLPDDQLCAGAISIHAPSRERRSRKHL